MEQLGKYLVCVALASYSCVSEAGYHLGGTRFFKEDATFGGINPDMPARPADQGPYPRIYAAPLPSPSPMEDDSEGQPRAPEQPANQLSSPPPKYRAIYDQASKRERGYGDDEDVSVAINVGFSLRSFSGGLGLTVPINRHFAWGVSGEYARRESDSELEAVSKCEAAIIFKIPNATPLTPFLSAGPGFESWKRSASNGVTKENFDVSNSPTANWALGASMRLARYVALVGALKSVTYTDSPPRKFTGDHSKREPRTYQGFNFGFAFVF